MLPAGEIVACNAIPLRNVGYTLTMDTEPCNQRPVLAVASPGKPMDVFQYAYLMHGS